MSEQDNLQLVQRIYEAFERGDIPAILDVLADDVEWWFHVPASVPFGGRRRGRDQVGQFFTAISENVEIDEFGPRGEFIAHKDTVVVLGHERVRAKPTGQAWETDWVHLWTLRDDKVVRFQEFSDSAAIVEAFLLSEPLV